MSDVGFLGLRDYYDLIETLHAPFFDVILSEPGLNRLKDYSDF